MAASSASCSGVMAFLASMTSASDAAASLPAPPPMPGEKKRPEPSTELLWRCLGRGGDDVSAARSRSEGPEDEIFTMSMKVEKRSSSEPISSKVSPSGPPPPPRPRSSGRRKATSDLARRWCAARAATGAGAGAGTAGGGKARPGGSAGSGCCCIERPAQPRLRRCRSRLCPHEGERRCPSQRPEEEGWIGRQARRPLLLPCFVVLSGFGFGF
uniref:Uncharacterized protein n=1 Tax=Zea mays TaxID=4577 RepID=C0PI57_MAIZE|nr:unknown [Zea mays]